LDADLRILIIVDDQPQLNDTTDKFEHIAKYKIANSPLVYSSLSLEQDVTNASRNAVDDAKGQPGKRHAVEAPVPRARNSDVDMLDPAVDVHDPSAAVVPMAVAPAPRAAFPVNPTSYQHYGQIDNIDERDAEDPLCATAYVEDMYVHFRSNEEQMSVRPIYMENQSHINERMRSILVDWLVEVHLKFKLVPETLYLTVNLIDRYLERKEVSRPKLQLVGVTCLLIASKYEEIYPPELRDLVYICDRAYTRNEVSIVIAFVLLRCHSADYDCHSRYSCFDQSLSFSLSFSLSLGQIIDMEETVLKTLDYKITIPSAHAFLVRYLKAAHADKRIVQLSCFILDGTLQSFNLLHYLPSQLAAAAVFIARRTVGRNSWSPTLLRYAGYCEEEVIPVARAVLAEKASTSTELKAVNKKYTSNRYGGVANTRLHCDF
jgi:cyclin B